MALMTDLADAVVQALTEGDFGQPLSAQRCYVPLFDLKEMKSLHVTVVPKGITVAALARGLSQAECQIDVAVQKKFDKGDAAELDPLMMLIEAIVIHFDNRRLNVAGGAACVKVENKPIYAPEHFEKLRQFTSVITLTFRVAR